MDNRHLSLILENQRAILDLLTEMAIAANSLPISDLLKQNMRVRMLTCAGQMGKTQATIDELNRPSF
jgi:hypothetical protein